MNGTFKRLIERYSPSGESSDSRGSDRNRSAVERSGEIKSGKGCLDDQTSWYDWVDPRWKQRQLKPRLDEALSRLERITDELGST